MRVQFNRGEALQSRALPRRRLIVRAADQSWRDAYAPLTSHSITIPAGKGKEITLQTGEIGRQASGAVMAIMGEALALACILRAKWVAGLIPPSPTQVKLMSTQPPAALPHLEATAPLCPSL